MSSNQEAARLQEARESNTPWRKWGPHLSERQWGTVREDYSKDGNAWDYFTHDQSRSRAYHWAEDGRRPVYGGSEKFQTDPNWKDLLQFYEYFHGDNGAGIGRTTRPAGPGLLRH